MEKLRQILRKLPINYNTLWKDAQILFKTCSDYADDEQLQTLDPLDVFSVYEDHIKYLEDQYNDMKEKQRMERRREERKNRDAFKELLKELRNSHVINIRSKWKEIYPYIQNDPRYLNMLGQSGSTPLELFWDTIQRIEDDYYQEKRTVMELIKVNTLIFILIYFYIFFILKYISVNNNNVIIIYYYLNIFLNFLNLFIKKIRHMILKSRQI